MNRVTRPTALSVSQRVVRADLIALVAYVLLAVLLTYPLILHFATHVPGDGRDDPALAWNLWWVPYALLDLQASPIYTDHMFYPIGLNLAFYTLTYLNAFLSIPFQYAFNLVVAANVNLLLSFALSGFGTYLLAKHLLGPPSSDRKVELAAFIAGALYAFSSNKLLYASLGQFNIASSQWIPFYVLFLVKLAPLGHFRFPIADFGFAGDHVGGDHKGTPLRSALQSPISNLRCGLLLGLFLLFQALSEFIFASFLLIFTALYIAYWLVAKRGRGARPVLIGLGIAALVFVIPMSPILAAMVQDLQAEGDIMQSGLGFADIFSSDLLGFVIPSALHPILGGLDAQFHFAYTNFAYLGWVALALAALAVWKVAPARVWGVLAAVFILISLGPDLRVNGAAIDAPWLPFNFLLEIPIVKGNRYPSRWSVMVTLALAILVAYGALWVFGRISIRRGRKAVAHSPWSVVRDSFSSFILHPSSFILLLLLFEHLALPLPLSSMTVHTVYDTIARDAGDFTVLEIPLAWRNGFRMTGTLDSAMMFEQWYQTKHQRPILGGNTSRNPELKFQYFTEAPVLNSLIAVETGHALDPARLQADRELAPAVLSFFGVRYIVWHSPRDLTGPQNRAALDVARAYIEQVLPVTQFSDETDETGQTIAYRVNELPTPADNLIRADGPLARLSLGEGWGAVGQPVVWSTRREARIFIRRDGRSTAETSLRLRLYSPTAQAAGVRVNGQAVGQLALQAGWGEYALPVPASAWRDGMNQVVLQFDRLVPAASVREGNRSIGTTGVVSPVSLVVRSAGSEIGDFAHIFVDGVEASPNQRGYNIVVVDASTGRVEARRAFDTFASEAESARLAQFIAEIPAGKIVALAVRDEASRYLTPQAAEALQTLGAAEDLQGRWRWSHAIVGVKGAPAGAALEAASEVMPAQLVVGVGAMEPNVSAALEWLSVMDK